MAAERFKIVQTNYIGFFDPSRCPEDSYKPWIQFMNEHSLVKDAIRLDAPLQIDLLRIVYTQATNRSRADLSQFSFSIENTEYYVTEHDVNRILGFPIDNHVPLPTATEMEAFFQAIQYQGVLDLTQMQRKYLVSEWDLFFETLAKVFSPGLKASHRNISSFIQHIGYAVAYNRRINLGKLVLSEIIKKMGTKESRALTNIKVCCYYPRFLSLFLNDILSEEHKELFIASPVFQSPAPQSNLFTLLKKQQKYPGINVFKTEYMAQFIDPPAQQPQAEPQEELQPEPEPQPQQHSPQQEQVDEVIPDPINVNDDPLSVEDYDFGSNFDPIFEKDLSPSGNIGTSDAPEIPQVQTTAKEPNTVSSSTTSSSLVKYMRSKQKANKRKREVVQEDSMRDPAALSPPTKILHTQPETTADSSLSSQQDMDFEMAIQQSLETSSQQGESIEIRRPATVSCSESSTSLALTLVEPFIFPSPQDTMQDESTCQDAALDATTPPIIFTIDKDVADVLHQMSSQAFEEQRGAQLPPIFKVPRSHLPGGTFLAPQMEFPSADLSGEVGRQLNLIEEGKDLNSQLLLDIIK